LFHFVRGDIGDEPAQRVCSPDHRLRCLGEFLQAAAGSDGCEVEQRVFN
jgi:hypothetical protein